MLFEKEGRMNELSRSVAGMRVRNFARNEETDADGEKRDRSSAIIQTFPGERAKTKYR